MACHSSKISWLITVSFLKILKFKGWQWVFSLQNPSRIGVSPLLEQGHMTKTCGLQTLFHPSAPDAALTAACLCKHGHGISTLKARYLSGQRAEDLSIFYGEIPQIIISMFTADMPNLDGPWSKCPSYLGRRRRHQSSVGNRHVLRYLN